MSNNYDGLQNNLATMDGVFLKKGDYTEPIDREAVWDFKPLAKVGDKVTAGDWQGEVKESWLLNRIMVPITMTEKYTVEKETQEGSNLTLQHITEPPRQAAVANTVIC